MNWKLKSTLSTVTMLLAAHAAAQVTFYEHDGFRGRAFTTDQQVRNFERSGFNDLASSAVVDSGRWEVCTDARFGGKCVVLRRGSYESLRGMNLNDRISSVRQVSGSARRDNEVPVPTDVSNYDYRRRANEYVYEARVTSVRAVVGQSEQRCWIEREQVTGGGRGDRNVGGAIIGGILGGVLGHQVGGGRGKDAATAGGAIAGALIGGNQGRGDSTTYDKDVQRCQTVTNTTPSYWDVTYDFRGQENRVQLSAAPGPTILVNRNGEPRQ